MREIVLDTETTGFNTAEDRIVEIGCVELEDHYATGNTYHVYINPEREMPEEAFKVHGISDEFLADKPKFAEIADGFLEFIKDDILVIHNARFDMRFLNMELERIGKTPLSYDRTVDSIEVAKAKLPGARYSLDELCRRFNVDLTRRDKHGALLDAELTADVYLELIGGRQQKLSLAPTSAAHASASGPRRPRPNPLPSRLTEEEAAAHAAFIEKSMGGKSFW